MGINPRGPRSREKAAVQDSLADLCADFFLLAIQISSENVELPDCTTLQQRIQVLFQEMMEKGVKRGFSPTEMDDARYAVAALIDEVIQFSSWPGKQQWMTKPLQVSFYGETIAGIKFFERLQEVRKRTPAAVEVYYYCLMLGFSGKYRMGEKEELNRLVEDLQREVVGSGTPRLSVHGGRPDDARPDARRFPLLPLAGLAIGLALIVAVILYVLLVSYRTDAVQQLSGLGRG